MGLRSKFLIALGFILATMLIAVFGMSQVWETSLESRLADDAELLLEKRSELLVEEVRSARQTLRLLASSNTLSERSIADTREALGRWNLHDSPFESFYFCDLQGHMHPAGSASFTISDRPYFENIRHGQEVSGIPLISRETGAPTFLLAVPVRDSKNQLAGALVGTLALTHILHRAMQGSPGNGGQLYIFDHQNRLLGSTLNEGTKLLTTPTPDTAPITHAIWNSLNKADMDQREKPQHQTPHIRGQKTHAFQRTIPGLNWKIIFTQSHSALTNPLQKTTDIAHATLMLAGLAGILIVFLLERLVITPLHRLQEAHLRVETGDLEIRANVQGKDEISKLAGTFNRMVIALGEARHRQQTIFNAFPYPITVNRLSDGKYVEVNPAFEEFINRPASDIIGQRPEDLNPHLDAESRHQQQAKLLAEHGIDSQATRITKPDGTEIWSLFSSRLIELDGAQMVLTVTADITRLKAAEAALRESEANLMAMFQQAPIPMSYSPYRPHITESYWNKAWYRDFGYKPENTEGKGGGLFGLWRDTAVRNEFLRRLADEQIVSQLEATLCRADGSERICEIYGSFIEIQGRKIVMTSYLDITERKQAERAQQDLNAMLEAKVEERTRELATTMRQLETANASTQEALETLRQAQNELIRSEKMAGLGSLVAGIAHELNTPIGNAVMISSTLSDTHRRFCKELDAPLKRSTLLHFTENVGESCAILSRNLERAIELVASFKQVAVDQSSYQRRHFELQEVADEIRLALSPTLRRATTELRLDIAPQIMLDSYPGPLGQILMNLINNALIHAFDPGQSGHITIVGRQQENGWITLTISDDGKGIPEENLGRIFDPFFTTRLGQGGSGLGLNITYNLVNGLLGGRIDVSSHIGQGTRFDINIPATAPPDSKPAARNAG